MKFKQEEIDGFIEGYRELCEKHNLYLTYDAFEADVLLQAAGEKIDIDEAVEQLRDSLNRDNVDLEGMDDEY